MLRITRVVRTFAILSLATAGLLIAGPEARAQGWGWSPWHKPGGYIGGRVIDPGRPGGRVFVDPGRPGGRLIPGFDPGRPGGRVLVDPGRRGGYFPGGHHHGVPFVRPYPYTHPY